jgi:RNA recognition motif-containing protein
VSNLEFSVNESELKELMSLAGNVLSVEIKRDNRSHKSKGLENP